MQDTSHLLKYLEPYPLECLESYPPAVREKIGILVRAERLGLPNPEWGLLVYVPYVRGKRVAIIVSEAQSQQYNLSAPDRPLSTPRHPSVKGNPIEKLRAVTDQSINVEAFARIIWGGRKVTLSITTVDKIEQFSLFRREGSYSEEEARNQLAETALACSTILKTDHDDDLTDFYEELAEFGWESTKTVQELDDELAQYQAAGMRNQKLSTTNDELVQYQAGRVRNRKLSKMNDDLADFYEELAEFGWKSTKTVQELDEELENYQAMRNQKLSDDLACDQTAVC